MGRVPNLGRVPTEPGNFWSRRSRKATIALIVLGGLIAFAVIGAFSSNSEEDNGSSSSSANNRPPKRATAEDEADEEGKSQIRKKARSSGARGTASATSSQPAIWKRARSSVLAT